MPTLLRLAALLALSGGISLAATPQTSAPASLQNPDKKVWTNDDLEGLRAKAPISTSAETTAKKSRAGENLKPDASPATVQRYRKQLQPLYAELPKIDAQLDQLHSFQDGTYRTTGGISRPLHLPANPADQITQLEKRKQEILAHISQIEDQARHDGVLPGDLR
jgi:hypothetical protein